MMDDLKRDTKEILRIVGGIDVRTHDHTDRLGKIAEAIHYLKDVRDHTGRMAGSLESMRDDQKELVGAVIGKRQAPVWLFVFICVPLLLILLVVLIPKTIESIKIKDWLSVDLHHDDAAN